MLKRIIFDEDDTLIEWKNSYNKSYKYALDELKISYKDEDIKNMIRAIDEYELFFDKYTKEDMINLINKYSNLNVPNDFIDVWMNYLCDCYSENDKKIIPTLEYLSKKYELVILSNWFSYNQVERLKRIGVDKYFTDMIFTEEVRNKPNQEAFLKACGPYKPEECLMVGDSMTKDINGAINSGLDAILVDHSGMYEYKNKIKNINELEELL